jgi:hypothetical protein
MTTGNNEDYDDIEPLVSDGAKIPVATECRALADAILCDLDGWRKDKKFLHEMASRSPWWHVSIREMILLIIIGALLVSLAVCWR